MMISEDTNLPDFAKKVRLTEVDYFTVYCDDNVKFEKYVHCMIMT